MLHHSEGLCAALWGPRFINLPSSIFFYVRKNISESCHFFRKSLNSVTELFQTEGDRTVHVAHARIGLIHISGCQKKCKKYFPNVEHKLAAKCLLSIEVFPYVQDKHYLSPQSQSKTVCMRTCENLSTNGLCQVAF